MDALAFAPILCFSVPMLNGGEANPVLPKKSSDVRPEKNACMRSPAADGSVY